MSHHDGDDWDIELAFELLGAGTGWVLVVTTAAAVALLAWHFFG